MCVQLIKYIWIDVKTEQMLTLFSSVIDYFNYGCFRTICSSQLVGGQKYI